MRLHRFLASILPAVLAMQAPASWAEDPAAPRPSFRDPEADLRFDTDDDRRRVIIANSSGGVLGVTDPLFDGDGGREGTIIAIRPATAAEMRYFKRESATRYVVLTYSGGGLLVISSARVAAVRPRRCGGTGAPVVDRNIACKLDLADAARRYLDAMNERFLVDGPSSIQPIEVAVPCSDIVLHVEADGRTVWAAKSGKRLWTEDPFEKAGLKPYRYRRPVIDTISPPEPRENRRCGARHGTVVHLRYNSSQMGELDARTGRFVFGGQD